MADEKSSTDITEKPATEVQEEIPASSQPRESEPQAEQLPVEAAEIKREIKSEEPKNGEPHPRKGRLIVAGLVATSVAAIIVVVVAAFFQISAIWLKRCPAELPVNDPAPILWSDITSEKPRPQALGPEDLVKNARLKLPVQSPEETAEAEKGRIDK
jgi:hypothetical protein